jgi:large subunit ribosomal protein L23
MNKYVFTIKRDSNKVEVKKAIESAYKVHVIQVNIITNAGKARNFGKTTGRTQGFKKAIVTLKKGDKIEGFDTI